jgi:uncharacterized membrane protein
MDTQQPTGGDSTGATNQNTAPQANPAPQQAQGGTDNRTLMGILAYIGILVLIPLLVEKNDSFVKYHVRQGLVLFVIEIGVWVIGSMIWMLAPVLMFVNLGALILAILGIVNVVNKKEAPLPLVGQFASHFNKI